MIHGPLAQHRAELERLNTDPTPMWASGWIADYLGPNDFLGVILGTGVGGGIVVRGHLLAGANAIAGEWGHNPLPSPTATTWTDTGAPNDVTLYYLVRAENNEACSSGPALRPRRRPRTSSSTGGSSTAMISPPRARTSSMLLISFSSSALFGATANTGIVASTSASGPCFSSPAA